MDQLVARITAQTPTQKEGVVALTFDDGLRNHVEVVYPS